MNAAVHIDALDPLARLLRVLIGRRVLDPVKIKEHQVRSHALLDQPAVLAAQAGSPVILNTAVSRGNSFRFWQYLAMARGNVPYHRGWGWPLDRENAPSSSACRGSTRMVSISWGEALRASTPMAASRMVPCPMAVPKLTLVPMASSISR